MMKGNVGQWIARVLKIGVMSVVDLFIGYELAVTGYWGPGACTQWWRIVELHTDKICLCWVWTEKGYPQPSFLKWTLLAYPSPDFRRPVFGFYHIRDVVEFIIFAHCRWVLDVFVWCLDMAKVSQRFFALKTAGWLGWNARPEKKRRLLWVFKSPIVVFEMFRYCPWPLMITLFI